MCGGQLERLRGRCFAIGPEPNLNSKGLQSDEGQFCLWEAGRAARGDPGDRVPILLVFTPNPALCQPPASAPLPLRPSDLFTPGLRSAGSDFPLPMEVAAHQRGFVRRKMWQPACGSRRNQGLSPSFPWGRCWWQGAPACTCRPWCGGRPCRGHVLGQPPCTAPKGGSNPGSACGCLERPTPVSAVSTDPAPAASLPPGGCALPEPSLVLVWLLVHSRVSNTFLFRACCFSVVCCRARC